MSYGKPQPPSYLPYPLHKISGKGITFNARRILYKENPSDDWMTWSCANIGTLRDGLFKQAVAEHPKIHFARQDFEQPINPEDL